MSEVESPELEEVVMIAKRMGMGGPLALFLEMHRPLSGIASFGLDFLAPFAPGLSSRLKDVVVDPEKLQGLIRRLQDDHG